MVETLGADATSFAFDQWLLSQKLSLSETNKIFDLYRSAASPYRRCDIRTTKISDLRRTLKRYVRSKDWPGDVDFSELRPAFERLRSKAIELLEKRENVHDGIPM